jgi:hypothetical protein
VARTPRERYNGTALGFATCSPVVTGGRDNFVVDVWERILALPLTLILIRSLSNDLSVVNLGHAAEGLIRRGWWGEGNDGRSHVDEHVAPESPCLDVGCLPDSDGVVPDHITRDARAVNRDDRREEDDRRC